MTILYIFIVFLSLGTKGYGYTTCPSFRIRGSAADLQRMAHCDVIAGNLVIDMINNNTSIEDWKKNGHLRLQEITEYLLLYDLSNLPSLDILFPNLNVIRGNKLLHDKYALGIFQVKQLETLSLVNLTAIVNGGVFISGNSRLNDYVHRIDWSKVTQSEHALNYIGDVTGDTQTCPNCSDGNCWSKDLCQKQCPPECKSCTVYGECCHELCLGGCSEPNDLSKCFSCRNFRDAFMQGCRDTCQDQQYEWKGFRCILSRDCINQGWKLLPDKNECVENCPKRYIETSAGACTLNSRNCTGGFIGSVKDSEKFVGCEKVKGSLWIRLSSRVNVTILELNLGDITEISGFIHIFESDVKSLNFLRRLSRIEGSELSEEKYALVVKDCKNLESLWPSSNTITINKGLAFFHLNPKLCPQTIEKAIQRKFLALKKPHLQSLLNGYQASCSYLEIDVKATAPFAKGVIKISFPKPRNPTHLRHLIGYWVYYYKKLDDSIFQGKGDIDSRWSLKFFPYNDEDDGKTIQVTLRNLDPASTYAIFVTSRMTLSQITYQSTNITYVTTQQFYPTRPRGLTTVYTDNTITYTWLKPSSTFGIIDFYKVNLTPITTRQPENVCSLGNLVSFDQKQSSNIFISNINRHANRGSNFPKLSNPEIEDVIDSLTNIILFNRSHEVPKPFQKAIPQKRSSSGRTFRSFSRFTRSLQNQKNNTEFIVKHPSYIIHRSSEAENIRYNIEIRACHNVTVRCQHGEKPPCMLCSLTPLKRDICLLYTDMDALPTDVEVSKVNSTHVKVRWSHPKIPGNLVQSYSIAFRRQKIGHASSLEQRFCVDSNTTEKISDVFSFPGNYEALVETVLECWNSSHVEKQSLPISFTITTSNLWTSILLHMSWLSLFGLIIFIIYRASTMWSSKKFDKLAEGVTIGTNTHSGVSGSAWWQHHFNGMIERQWNHKAGNLTLGKKLGEGHFAKVFEGTLKTRGGAFLVAAKVLKKLDQLDKDLINEATLMLEARSFHLVRSYGMVLKNFQLYLIMEFMTNGNLETFLKQKHRGAYKQTQYGAPEQLLNFALQVADGMYYLQTKKIIHRDLAARNCLLDQSYNIKISDFGLSRFTREGGYQMRNSRLLELARMPPEIFKNELFTHKSDVWLFGILLWELATECSRRPHEGLREEQLRVVILGGKTLVESFPHSTPFYIIPLAMDCWRRNPSQRLSFQEILSRLLIIAKEYTFYEDFRSNSCYFQGDFADDNTDFYALSSDEEIDSATPLTQS